MALTPKQELFVRHYVRTLNAKQAAIAAGYSPKTAEVQGSRLLRNAQVASAVEKAGRAAFQRIEFDADMVLQGFAVRAFGDFRQLFDEHGRLKAPHELDDLTARLVTSFEAEQVIRGKGEDAEAAVITKVKMADPLRALENLAKYYQLFRPDDDNPIDEDKLKALPPEEYAALKAKAIEARETLKTLLRERGTEAPK